MGKELSSRFQGGILPCSVPRGTTDLCPGWGTWQDWGASSRMPPDVLNWHLPLLIAGSFQHPPASRQGGPHRPSLAWPMQGVLPPPRGMFPQAKPCHPMSSHPCAHLSPSTCGCNRHLTSHICCLAQAGVCVRERGWGESLSADSAVKGLGRGEGQRCKAINYQPLNSHNFLLSKYANVV